ncbi:preprotein translocase subunit SecG [Parascardovia denticolens IPLA 20019]|mgnify:CR=1 FL=1|uniref:Protein-export membrane protein SecG n=1 Tax=Parascardovia denticolens DSM 10105 = JCM 12538 TaxID=864564 RepID=E6JYD0_PARDN|nr:preprotein translocase subunit SecG [Parascardovia denticolens]EFG33375.1 preprotein translocase, SecG subunit [Parascardovia denticolens F0305]EFT83807.1 preprotein translocase, SecG subunit [Parascardovia denticolens DSM 10105 = JCM 12538]EIT87855.1 preprotein translocase subunit SecG [Parascardovia denticolens IPLA 20019]BAR05338.1 preprotein translocase subunit SecG [Parascardovia denticolens DSM 10105 = JCM 12538]
MHALKITLEIVVVILSLLLTMLILMHKGKGGGLSDMFGGGITQNAGTSGVAEKNLNRITVVVALIWVTLIIALDFMSKFNVG